MKIILIITDYGSFNNFLAEVAVNLVELQHEVNVICGGEKIIDVTDKFDYEGLGIKFHFTEFPRSYNFLKLYLASIKIKAIIEQIEPDIVHVHFTTGVFTTVLSGKLRYFTAGTIHGIGYPVMESKVKQNIFKIIEHFCFRRLDRIYVLNNFDYSLLIKTYAKKVRKFSSSGVGCDLAKFNKANYTSDFLKNFRQDLSIKPHDFVIAFTGRFVHFKGFHLVVRGFLSLVEKYELTNIKLLLIGGRDPVHPTGLSDEEDLLYKNHNQIINVGFTAKVNDFLAITDLFVFPSFKEGMPVCVMEALAMGVPVVTADARGCNDLVDDKVNGLLLPEKPSVAEVQSAIYNLYSDKNTLKQYSDNAISTREVLGRQKYVEQQLKDYSDLIK